MSKISVINRNSGEVIFRAFDHPKGILVPGMKGEKHKDPILKNIKSVDEFVDLLTYFSDKVLVKSDGIEINNDKEDTQAQVNMPAPGNGEEPVSSEDISHRIDPAIKIIKEIIKRAESRKKERAALQAHTEALKLEQQHAIEIVPLDGQFYVTMDGDGIGNQVARAQYTNDEQKVREVSNKIDSGKSLFVQWGVSYAGIVVEAGGDEGQVRVPAAALEHIEEFRSNYLKQVGATVTVGVGKTISQSIQARELGKLRGKNQVVYYDENTEKELQLRIDQKGEETPEKKLKESGVLEPVEKEQKKLGEQPDKKS